MKIRFLTALALCACMAAGCSGGSGDGRRPGGDSLPAAPAACVSLPVVPDSLVTPESRADYLVLHFWDPLDFADTVHSLDTAYMEQSFANYASVLPFSSDSIRSVAVDAMLRRAAGESPAAGAYVLDIAREYLFNPESPMYDDMLYRPFAEYVAATATDLGARMRAEDALEEIARNKPGTPAPDFAFVASDGRRHTLAPGASQTPVLLMFYEPDCAHCREAFGYLAASASLRAAVDAGRLRVVAVYPGDNDAEWREHAATLPASWTVGRDEDGIIDRDGLYVIKATPSFYLIAPDGNIGLKDRSFASTASMLGL